MRAIFAVLALSLGCADAAPKPSVTPRRDGVANLTSIYVFGSMKPKPKPPKSPPPAPVPEPRPKE